MKLLGTRPERRVVLAFAGAILVGTILLALPVSSSGARLSLVDALFTATSAICVTGLVVVDTATAFSRFGQVVLLLLIQVGGLGMMTLATALLLSLASRLSFRHAVLVTASLAADQRVRPRSLVRAVVATALVFEGVGTVLLFLRFRTTSPPGTALFDAVFHAVSAFCNAGFSTWSDSLVRYAGDVYVLSVVAALVISGGLGFVVIREIAVGLHTRHWRLSLHTKICLGATAVLLVFGAVGFLLAESSNLLADQDPLLAGANAVFQSVTVRTAGFNALDQARLTETSVALTILLMFIGACPGSTAGGIKTTTFAILVLAALGRLAGRRSLSVFRRSVSLDSQQKASTVVLLALGVLGLLFTVLMFVEERPIPHLESQGLFVESLFEAVSAFATVGLSLGATATLQTGGKFVIMILMFVGRVGLLTLAFSLSRGLRAGQLVYPDEDVMVG